MNINCTSKAKIYVITFTSLFSDLTGDFLEISVNSDRDTFAFNTYGSHGDTSVEVPGESDMVHSFQWKRTAKAIFPMHMIKYALKSLHMASKVSLRMDNQEILCLQYLIMVGSGQCFLEYFFTPQIESEVEAQCECED